MDEQETFGVGQSKKSVSVGTLVVILTVAALVLATATWYVGFLSGALKAKDEIAALKAAAKLRTEVQPPAVKPPVVEAAALAVIAPVPAVKVEQLPSSNELYWNPGGGEWTVILHTLAEDAQLVREEEETKDAFKKCSEETDYILTPCVSMIKDQKTGPGYNTYKASLATVKNGLNARWALRIADCFNRNMKPVKKKDGTMVPNAADAVKLRNFEPVCLPAK